MKLSDLTSKNKNSFLFPFLVSLRPVIIRKDSLSVKGYTYHVGPKQIKNAALMLIDTDIEKRIGLGTTYPFSPQKDLSKSPFKKPFQKEG